MSFEWIGFATVIVGLLCIVQGRRFAIYSFVCSTLLGAAAASVLTALGSANLPPATLLLGFLVLMVLWGPLFRHFVQVFAWPKPGFWLLMTLIYATVVAIFSPRILAGATYVFTIARTDAGPGLLLTPLAPVSGNLTQMAYFAGDVFCFAVCYVFARDREGKHWMAQALLACGVGNILFAALDYLTFFTGTADSLGFMRNATYRMLDTAEVLGFKRLVGSFPEASAFASTTLALFAFALNLWLNGYRSRLVGPLALLLFAALILSTSTTAYAGVSLYLALVYAGGLLRLVSGRSGTNRIAFLLLAPILGGCLVMAIMLDDALTITVSDTLQQLIFLKGTTASALERGSWNTQAMTNFFDSYGFGVGVGSARASNVLIAVLANIGVFGAVTYGAFAVGCFRAPRLEPDPGLRAIREAAASACLALLVAGCLAGTTIDLGLLFFICAALAASPTFVREPAAAGAVARSRSKRVVQKPSPSATDGLSPA
ncbi:hypothetical protein G3T14_19400 [Methylobacterium sp. BTF04]|uniref:hypothetical protein n=1 Tax=Methylobacterium sp. BTF04 TaxID=2708300 RepID=UPI0013D3E876|nr:hypothetical protein [Methylobacterium sp. BTF04]NEU14276.1 hypothetical protein [Methylobacterium sp. BTF04]